MATKIVDRSTYWFNSGGSNPSSDDFRPYWKIYYDTDLENNRTLITVDYYLQQTKTTATSVQYSYSIRCNINGSNIGTISGTKSISGSTTMVKLGSKTTYIYHNQDGSASFTWQGRGTIYNSTKSTATSTYSTTNGDFPAIPQGMSVSQSIASKSESAILVNWNTGDTVDYIWYSINGGSSYTAVGSASGTSGSYVISGLSPNTTYNIVTRARRQSSQIDTNYSSTASVTTYTPPTITSISDVTETSFKINWTSSYSADWAQYSLNNGTSWTNLPSGNVVTGLSPNTNYQVKVRLRHTETQTMYQSGSVVVPKSTYDYPKVTSFSNFTIGTNPTITLYNPLGRSCVIYLIGKDNSTIYTGTRDINGNTTLYPDASEIDAMYRSIPNDPNAQYKIRLVCSAVSKDTTINGGTYYANESDCKPTISASYFDYIDSNDDATTGTVRLTGDNSIFVLNYSTLHLTLNTSLQGENYASISKIFVNSVPYDYTNNFTLDLQNYSSSAVSIYAVDTRGIASDTITINLNIKDYFNIIPSIDYSYERSNNGVGNQVNFKFKGTFWNKNFGNEQNTLEADYVIYNQKTNVTTTGQSTINLTINQNDFSFDNLLYGDTNNGFDVDTKYTVTINIRDLLSSIQYVIQIIEGTPAIALYGNKISLGAKYDTTLGGDVQLNGEIYINGQRYTPPITPISLDDVYPVGSIYLSTRNVSPATLFGGTWTQLTGYYLYAGTGGTTAGSNTTSAATGNTGSTTLTAAQSGLRNHDHSASGSFAADFYIRHGNTAGTDTVAGGNNTTIDEGVGETWGNGIYTSTYSHQIDRVNINGAVSTTVNGSGNVNATEGHTHSLNGHTHTVEPVRFEVYTWYRTA